VPSHRLAGAFGDAYVFRVDARHRWQDSTIRTEPYASAGSSAFVRAVSSPSGRPGLMSERWRQ
jgi:hypothetical protein